jgi:hypothetical protein
LPTGNNADLIPLQKLLDQYILPAVKSDQPLPANPDGQARLQDAIQALAKAQPVTSNLPSMAKEISGKTYTMNENPFGWQTIEFSFPEDKEEAQIVINDDGPPAAIGLDHSYRFLETGENPFPTGLRGVWKDADTFVVESIVLGAPVHYQAIVDFTGDKIHITQVDDVNGGEAQADGTLSD